MLRVTAKLRSASHIIFSKRVTITKQAGEDDMDAELRMFREKAHVKDGRVFIPSICFKRALDSTAQTLKRKAKGKGNTTFARLFQSGIMAGDDVVLDSAPEDLKPEQILCNSRGMKGGAGGSQVARVFPLLPSWRGDLELFILNDDIPPGEIEHHLVAAGRINGVGSFRAQNGGLAGRFVVESFKSEEYTL